MRRRWVHRGVALAVVALVGCGGPLAQRRGRVVIHLTDAPQASGALRTAELYVARIDARLDPPEHDELTRGIAEHPADSAGWVPLSEPRQALDLLSLRGGTLAMIGGAELDPGNYHAVRLIVVPGRSRVTLRRGGVIHLGRLLDLPDGARIAIPVALARPLRIAPARTTELVIDFDVARTFAGADRMGRGGAIRFTPVVRAAERATMVRRLSQASRSTESSHDEHR